MNTELANRIKYLTPEMYQEFVRGIEQLNPRKMSKERIKLLFETMLSGAFRVSEVLELIPSDILPNGTILLRKTKTGWKRCKCSKWTFKPLRLMYSDSKCTICNGNGKYRINQEGWVSLNVHEDLTELAKSLSPNEKLFPITRRQVWNYSNEIGNCGTHAFRHTWLTWLIETNQLDLGKIKDKSRHTSLATLSVYIESNKDLARIKEREALQIPGTKEIDLI